MVSKDKEKEILNTIKNMLNEGDKEEDVISLFVSLGLEENYIRNLILKLKHDQKTETKEIPQQKKEENIDELINEINKNENKIKESNSNIETNNKTNTIHKDNKQKTIHESIDPNNVVLVRLEKIEKKLDYISKELENIKEDTSSSKSILEKLLLLYRKIINKLISKYT